MLPKEGSLMDQNKSALLEQMQICSIFLFHYYLRNLNILLDYLFFTISIAGLALSGSRTGAIVSTMAFFIYILKRINFKESFIRKNIKFIFLIIIPILLFQHSKYIQDLTIFHYQEYYLDSGITQKYTTHIEI